MLFGSLGSTAASPERAGVGRSPSPAVSSDRTPPLDSKMPKIAGYGLSRGHASPRFRHGAAICAVRGAHSFHSPATPRPCRFPLNPHFFLSISPRGRSSPPLRACAAPFPAASRPIGSQPGVAEKKRKPVLGGTAAMRSAAFPGGYPRARRCGEIGGVRRRPPKAETTGTRGHRATAKPPTPPDGTRAAIDNRAAPGRTKAPPSQRAPAPTGRP